MLIEVLRSLLGLVALVAGGEILVRGATALAGRVRLSPAVIGLTVVAAGTSLPELVVSVDAAFSGAPDLAIGNVVGSNIYNILLILGVSALVRPLTTTWTTVRLEWPVMALASWNLLLLARDGRLDRLEGAYFVAGLVVFVAWTVRMARQDAGPEERASLEAAAAAHTGLKPPSGAGIAGRVIGGAVLLAVGADLLVQGASALAATAGVSERVIGLTLVALGTSLPELVTSVLAAWRGQSGIAVGNVIGSNIFNILGILGVTALILPIPIQAGTIRLDLWVMLGTALLLLPLMRTGFRINRWEGGLLLGGALAWSAALFAGGS